MDIFVNVFSQNKLFLTMIQSKANANFELLKSKTKYSVPRIGVLYKDFKDDKQLNPEGFEANLISWYNILQIILENDSIEGSKLTLPHKKPVLSLLLVLPTIGKPLGIDIVVKELVESRHLIPVSTFLNYDSHINNYLNPPTGLAAYFYPSHWMEKVSGIVNNSIGLLLTSNERYVHWNYLVDFSKVFLNEIKKEVTVGAYSSRIFDDKLLISLIHDNITSNFLDLDLQVLLKHISRDTNECKSRKENDSLVVKFGNEDVNEEDLGIAQLRWSMHQVLDRIATSELKIKELNLKISEYPVEKIKKDKAIKASVMHLLGQRRAQVKVLEQCSNTHTQLTELLQKIDDATSNISVVNALKQSSITLQQLNKQVDIDEVEGIQMDIQEQIDTTNQISEVLAPGLEDDDDIEEEYNTLVKQQEKDEKESTALLKKLEDLSVDSEIKQTPPNKEKESSDKRRLEEPTQI